MSGFVYIWKETQLKKYYIGSHWGHPNDRYICSSNSMRKQYERNPQNFKRRIISTITTNRPDLLDEEQRWLDMIKPEEFGIKYYNISSKANKGYWWMNEETKRQVVQKIHAHNEGYVSPLKGRISPFKGQQNRWSEEHKQKLSLIMKESPSYQQSRISRKPHSEETKQKLRLAHLGKKLSEEHRRKLSESHKGQIPWCKGKKLGPSWNKGKSLSAEHKRKLSEAHRNRYKRTGTLVRLDAGPTFS